MDYNEYGPLVMRIFLGLLFILPGWGKLSSLMSTGTHMVVGMLGGITTLAWVLAIVEIVCGLMVLVGFKARLAAWPLVVVLLGALVVAIIPGRANDPVWIIKVFFHLVSAWALIGIAMNGAGPMAIDQE